MRLIRLKEVIHQTGLGRSSIYKFMANNKFPQSISLGERAIAWEVTEIEEWILARIENRVVLETAPVNTKPNLISEADVITFIKAKFNQLGMREAITWLMKIIN